LFVPSDSSPDDQHGADIPLLQGPPTESEQREGEERNYKDRQLKIQRLQLYSNWAIVFLTLGSAVFALSSLREAQKANELSAKIIKGSFAAFFDPTFVFSESGGYVDIGFQNQGKVRARTFSADLTLSKKAIPGLDPIGRPQTVRISKGQIQPVRPSAGQTVTLNDWSDSDKTHIEHNSEVIVIEGSFQYDNGFGDIVVALGQSPSGIRSQPFAVRW